MKFKKQTNGNILVTDDSDNTIILIQNIPTLIEAKGADDYLQIFQNSKLILDFLSTDVTAYQILPAAEVAFASSASVLIDILSANFFLINSSVIPSPLDVNVISPNPLPVSGSFSFQYPEGALDAFARQRMSQPVTIFDSKLVGDNRPRLYDDQEVSGSGTLSTYNINSSSVTLSVSATTAGKRIRQTFRRFNYQPGKSQLIILTGILSTPTTGNSKKIGIGTNENGLFFDSTDSTIGVNIRSFSTGAAVTNRAVQSTWNLDKMNGTGASGIDLDFSKTQIFFFDFQWLGVGSVRFGFFVDGVPIYCHVFHHANIETEAYMTSPNLPIRYEIENDGTGSADSMMQICSTVISEGGYRNTGYPINISRDGTAMQTGNNSDLHVLLAFRLKSGFLGSTVQIKDYSIICTSTSAYEYYWIVDPIITGVPLNFINLSNSSIEYDGSTTDTTTVTNGTGIIIEGGVGYQGNQGGVTSDEIKSYFAPGSNIGEIPQIIVLAVRRVTGANESFYGAANLTDQK
jgi:hypothetical protein